MATIASLAVTLRSNTERYEKGIRRAQRLTRTFINGLKRARVGAIALGGSLAGALAGAGLTVLFKRTASVIDANEKMRRSLGLTAEELATLEIAASRGGSSLEAMQGPLRAFIRRMDRFIREGKGAGAKAFEQLGIGAGELSRALGGQGIVGALDLVIERMKAFEREGGQAAPVWMDLMTKRGLFMANVLGEGASSMAKFREEAREAGLAVDPALAAGVEAFNDTLDEFGTLIEGFRRQLVGSLAGPFDDALDRLREFASAWAREQGGMGRVANQFARGLLDGLERAVTVMAELVNFAIRVRNFFTSGRGTSIREFDIDKLRGGFQTARTELTEMDRFFVKQDEYNRSVQKLLEEQAKAAPKPRDPKILEQALAKVARALERNTKAQNADSNLRLARGYAVPVAQ